MTFTALLAALRLLRHTSSNNQPRQGKTELVEDVGY
jgi:hypothetical protein